MAVRLFLNFFLITSLALALAQSCAATTITSINDSGNGLNVNSQTAELLFYPSSFTLSNGANDRSGAGNGFSDIIPFNFASEQTVGKTTQLVMNVPVGATFVSFYNFASTDPTVGSFDAQATFVTVAPLVLVVDNSSPNIGVISGSLKLTSDSILNDPAFIPLGAAIGSEVPFEITYTLQSDTWHLGMKNDEFGYSYVGAINVGSVAPEPGAISIFLVGLSTLGALAALREPTKK